jgi:hypothetical protein
MKTGQLIAYIAAAILIFFGVLFVWAAFGEQSKPELILVGVITIGAGLGIIWFARRAELRKYTTEVIQKIDLSGDIDLEKLTCKNCNGNLSSDNIKMIAGAPVVNCPYCGTSYQLSEEPKW